MNVVELIQALVPFSDDTEVIVTVHDQKEYHHYTRLTVIATKLIFSHQGYG